MNTYTKQAEEARAEAEAAWAAAWGERAAEAAAEAARVARAAEAAAEAAANRLPEVTARITAAATIHVLESNGKLLHKNGGYVDLAKLFCKRVDTYGELTPTQFDNELDWFIEHNVFAPSEERLLLERLERRRHGILENEEG